MDPEHKIVLSQILAHKSKSLLFLLSTEKLKLNSTDVQIRLSGINVTYAGRVENCSHGVWGRITGPWEKTKAEVVCRLLGVPGNVTALKYPPFWRRVWTGLHV